MNGDAFGKLNRFLDRLEGETAIHRYKDLREWLQIVDDMGQLARLDGANWDLEIGAITDMVCRSPDLKPALLFDGVVGHAPGYRVLTSSLNSIQRLALTCGLSTDVKDLEFVSRWASHYRECGHTALGGVRRQFPHDLEE